MKKRNILIDSNPFETRMALLEDDKLVEFYVERPEDRGITGNIYKGRIVRVLPGMQAAFVEVGLDRTAFLHVSDVKASFDDLDDDGPRSDGRGGQIPRIQDMIKQGEEVMVQVAKEPIGTKGARVTSYVSLPGRFLVLMPTYERIGVSRRISDDKERRRLRDIVKSCRPEGYGFIVRTVCDGVSKEEIQADMDFLVRLWQGIVKNKGTSPNPSLLYEELDLTLRTLRDKFSRGDRLTIGSRVEYDRVSEFVGEFMPSIGSSVKLHKNADMIFDAYGVDLDIERALSNKVWLKSGGSLVIDQMEALTAIDVNTGKYVGKKNSEDTILKTNLESALEVVYQLRLRNIGGIIVIDFIDMMKAANREKVYSTLKAALKVDKARTNILKISELGIVEMTRKRTRESLSQSLGETCHYCGGSGVIKAKDTVVMEIYRQLRAELPDMKRSKALLFVNPAIAERLDESGVIRDMERATGKHIVVKSVDVFHQEEFDLD